VKNDWTTRYILKKLGYQGKIIELPQPITLEASSFHIFIGKNSSFLPYIKQVDGALKQMKRDGTLQRIFDQYK